MEDEGKPGAICAAFKGKSKPSVLDEEIGRGVGGGEDNASAELGSVLMGRRRSRRGEEEKVKGGGREGKGGRRGEEEKVEDREVQSFHSLTVMKTTTWCSHGKGAEMNTRIDMRK